MMNCKKIVAGACLVLMLFPAVGLAEDISNLPADAANLSEEELSSKYGSLLSTPQGQELLNQMKPGSKVTLGKEETGGVSRKVAEAEVDIDVENNFSQIAKLEGLPEIRLFGYSAFQKAVSSFVPAGDLPAPYDYVIGPGDSFNITIWGISEGVFKVTVNQQGEITLPKVGVVGIAGIKYGELKPFIEKQMGRYYEQVNVSISMDKIKSIKVYIVGEVIQPGSYTVSSLSTLYSALFQAGGPTKYGTMRQIKLIRGGRTIATVDLYKFLLKGDKSQDRTLLSGDTIFVPLRGEVVGITGNVMRSAIYEIKGVADLSDIIALAGGFSPLSYLNRIQIERIVAHQRKIVVDKNISSSKERTNIALQDMDLVKVYPIYSDIQNVVFLEGNFKYVGPYEWKPGMRVKDIISSKDILKPYSYLPRVELIRRERETLKTNIIDIDLEKLFANDLTQNVTLEVGDRLIICSDFKGQPRVAINGEVRLPGTYFIRKGEMLSSVLKRAGGFTDDAYVFGAVFIRKAAQDIQENALNKFIVDFEKKLLIEQAELSASTYLTSERIAQKTTFVESKNQLLFNSLRNSVAVRGRVIIHLTAPDKLVDTKDDVELEDGDVLTIPKFTNIVSVIGEVYTPSCMVYEKDKKLSYYLSKVGGLLPSANAGGIYIFKADGSVVSGSKVYKVKIDAGDAVIVPQLLASEKFDFWSAFTDFTHWFYEATLAFVVIATYLK